MRSTTHAAWHVVLLAGLVPCFVVASCGTLGGLDDFHEVDCVGADCVDGSTSGGPNGPDGSGPGSSGGPATIGGTLSGLKGTGLVLQDNGGDDLGPASDGPFAFATKIPSGAPYAVSVNAQPSGPTQTCTVDHGAGTSNGTDVTDVVVTCSTAAYSIGGSVVSLNGTGLVLSDNGTDMLPIAASGPFTFTTKVASGSPFAVAVATQPATSGPCRLSGATGVVGVADVTGVLVNCDPNSYAVGGAIKGLTGTVVLQNKGANDLTVTASDGTFTFPQTYPSGTTYAVTVKTQPGYPPRAQTCVVTSGSGSIGSADVTNVAVNCTTNTYTVGGSVRGLTGTLVLTDANGGGQVTVSADGSFSFPTPKQSGSTYLVGIATQPNGEDCSVSMGTGSGVVTNANVTSIAVTCVCNGPVGGCTSDAQCCAGKCSSQGQCVAACGGVGAACMPGICCYGTACKTVGVTPSCQACVPHDAGPCTADKDCCSGSCRLAVGTCR